ncbi:MAG: MG2 domain-containing protein, partial [Pseudomonadota bacterium]
TLPNLDGLSKEKTPVAFIANKSDDLSFLPYSRNDREVNYSKFDINGLQSTSGMNAYLFNDRGIYRPGETAHIGIIVKAKDWAKSMEGLPLILEITNPHGQVVDKQILHLSKEGILTADFTSTDSSATGIYNASLYLGRDNNEKGLILGNVLLRVEEFLPDRMKMSSVFIQYNKSVEELAWVKPEQLKVDVNLMQLYGAPAKSRRITGKINLAPGYFGFNTYKDYSFIAGNSTEKSFDEVLPESKTDEQGKASFPINLDKYKASTFRMTFCGEGFEADSGRSVKTSKSVLVSPLDFVVGVKENGNLNYINPNDSRVISLIAINQSLAKIVARDLTVELKKIKTIQSLTKDNRGEYNYKTTTIETLLKSDKISISESGLQYKLPTETSGSFALIYKNTQGIVLAKVPFTVIGEANAAAGFTREASMQVTLDKPAYKSGDEIKLNIESPYIGTGLITIETDKVLAYQWFNTTTTSSVQKIKIPKDFEGKGFINVQFTRDLKSKEIFISPFSFAVIPFTAIILERDSHIVLDVPKEVKPGDVVNVSYKTKNNSKIIIYAVDEGILLFAHYKNPDPIEYFLMKRGLEVSTTQIMDLLLPEYSILKSLSQIGGDGFANDGKNLNPFKRRTQPPVAYWSGIIDSGNQTHNWSFT